MKGMMTVFEQMIDDWKMQRDNFERVVKMFTQQNFVTFLSSFNFIMTNTYYWGTVPLTNILMGELQIIASFVQIYSRLLFVGISISFIFALYYTIKVTKKIMMNYYAMFYIMPYSLLEKNLVFRHKLRKVAPSSKFYKL